MSSSSDTLEKVHLTVQQALLMLPDGDLIHTFRQAGPMLLGADIERKEIAALLAIFDSTVQLAGPAAAHMKHGIVLTDDTGPLFIATREDFMTVLAAPVEKPAEQPAPNDVPTLDERIAAQPGRKVTPEQIKAVQHAWAYHVFPGTTVTVCLITLRNGFTVLGKSACADPTAFDEFIGRQLAYADATSQIWALEGYLLRERMFAEQTGVETLADANALHVSDWKLPQG